MFAFLVVVEFSGKIHSIAENWSEYEFWNIECYWLLYVHKGPKETGSSSYVRSKNPKILHLGHNNMCQYVLTFIIWAFTYVDWFNSTKVLVLISLSLFVLFV